LIGFCYSQWRIPGVTKHTNRAIAAALIVAGWAVATDINAATTGEKQLAFPTAEGFGRFARGGRGGDVYHVTSLGDDGSGSLREGIRSATGPRTIVFDLSGTIVLQSRLVIDKSYITIAGQSAPGDGICLRDHTFRIKNASHIIVRYLRFRLGDQNKPRPSGDDCINTDDIDQVIFDHISASWGIDGNHDLRRGGNFTLQWSIYAEALNDSIHGKGPHAMLASFRDLTAGISLHHNLFASSRERHPTLGGSPRTDPEAIVDFRNNVVYNVEGATNLGNCKINFVNNYYRPGPNTPANHRPIAVKTENRGALKAYLAANVFERASNLTRDNYAAIDFARWIKGNYLDTTLSDVRADSEFNVADSRPRTQSATAAYESVLQSAGASLGRDAADIRLVNGIRDRSHRSIDSQEEVGGWPKLQNASAPLDQDGDGMSDKWELACGLNPGDRADGNGDSDKDGYTNLEEYLESLIVRQ
jgi:pectinesterase